MCYPKPGPRCASHLRQQIKRLTARRDAMLTEFANGAETGDINALNREIETARGEYAETASQRRKAADRIAEMPDGRAKERAQASVDAAAARYAEKVAAYKGQRSVESRDLLTAVEEVELGTDIQAGHAATALAALETTTERRAYLRTLPAHVLERVVDPETGGVPDNDRLDYLQQAGDASRTRMIETNLGLVYHTVHRFSTHGRRTSMLDDSDLVAVGMSSLVDCADSFKPEVGIKFSSHAVQRIRWALVKACDESPDTVMNMPLYQVDLWRRTRRLYADHRANGKPFHAAEAAEELAAHPADVERLLRIPPRSWVSTPEEADARGVLPASTEPTPHEVAASKELVENTRALLTTLPEREELVIVMRHGLDDDAPRTLDEIGAVLGVSRERVRQLESKAMKRLRFASGTFARSFHELLVDD